MVFPCADVTQKSQQAVLAARQSAERHNHQSVLPLHLFDAMLGQTDTILYPLQEKLDANPTALHNAVETGLGRTPQVYEAVVIGDRRKFLSVVVTLDEEVAEWYMLKHNLEGPAHTNPQVRNEIQEAMHRQTQPGLRQGRATEEVCDPPASDVCQLSIECGELNPMLKVKRNKVNEHFANIINGLYRLSRLGRCARTTSSWLLAVGTGTLLPYEIRSLSAYCCHGLLVLFH